MYVTAQALYVTTGKYANPSIRCGATVSVILPVMPDVLDIVIVLQHINELLHILQVALIGEGDVVLGLLPQGVQRFFTMAENYFFTHEPKLNIHHEYSVFPAKHQCISQLFCAYLA